MLQDSLIMMNYSEALCNVSGKNLLSCTRLLIYEALSNAEDHCSQCLSLNHCCEEVYPNVVASGDHVSQLVLTARSGAQVVADWLVSLPPGPPGIVQHNVFIWRGDLSTTEEKHDINDHC